MKNLNIILIAGSILAGCGAPTSSSVKTSSVAVTNTKGIDIASTAQSDIPSDIGLCNASNEGKVCLSNDTTDYYFCSAGNWSQTTIMPTTTTMTVAPDSGSNCIGSTAPVSTATVSSNSDTGSETWTSPTTGLVWTFGNTFTPAQLASNNANAFAPNFLCPAGSVSPTQAQFNTEFGSSFVNWLGSSFVITGVVNASYKGTYYIEIGDAEGNFDLISGMQITTITAVCVRN